MGTQNKSHTLSHRSHFSTVRVPSTRRMKTPNNTIPLVADYPNGVASGETVQTASSTKKHTAERDQADPDGDKRHSSSIAQLTQRSVALRSFIVRLARAAINIGRVSIGILQKVAAVYDLMNRPGVKLVLSWLITLLVNWLAFQCFGVHLGPNEHTGIVLGGLLVARLSV